MAACYDIWCTRVTWRSGILSVACNIAPCATNRTTLRRGNLFACLPCACSLPQPCLTPEQAAEQCSTPILYLAPTFLPTLGDVIGAKRAQTYSISVGVFHEQDGGDAVFNRGCRHRLHTYTYHCYLPHPFSAITLRPRACAAGGGEHCRTLGRQATPSYAYAPALRGAGTSAAPSHTPYLLPFHHHTTLPLPHPSTPPPAASAQHGMRHACLRFF